MKKIDHPNVMKIKDIFEDDARIHLVMDLRVDDMRNMLN